MIFTPALGPHGMTGKGCGGVIVVVCVFVIMLSTNVTVVLPPLCRAGLSRIRDLNMWRCGQSKDRNGMYLCTVSNQSATSWLSNIRCLVSRHNAYFVCRLFWFFLFGQHRRRGWYTLFIRHVYVYVQCDIHVRIVC